MIGDFVMNCLKYHENAKTRYFCDNIFEKGATSIINRTTRIPEHSTSLIDNILTTDIFDNSLLKPLKLIKPLYKSHKRLLKNSTNFLLLLDQHWREKSPILKNHFKTF